jgi:hypothetical protein
MEIILYITLLIYLFGVFIAYCMLEMENLYQKNKYEPIRNSLLSWYIIYLVIKEKL